MTSIITITLNPVIDKSTEAGHVLPGKKLRCSAPVFQAGGGGVNVARVINKLGGKTLAIYFAGGYTGKFFQQIMKSEKIDSLVIEIEKHTRENLVVLDKAMNEQYRFNMPGPEISEGEWQKLLRTVEDQHNADFMVASGSISPGIPADIFARIAMIAQKKNIRLVVDSSGESLRLAMEKGVYLAKPNLLELAELIGKKEIAEEEAKDAAKKIISNFNVQILAVSLGNKGAILVTKNEAYHVPSPVVEVKSTVGAGDSMVAGMVWALAQNKNLENVLKYGVACGTAAAMQPGTALCEKAEAERIYLQLQIHNSSVLI